MAETRLNRYWAIAIIFLMAVIIITVFVAWSRYRPSQPIEISLPPEQEISGNINISGAVANPGIYQFSVGDIIGSLIQAVVLTHPHLDHLTGLLEVLQRYKVQQVLYLDTDYQTPPEQEWLTLIHSKGVKATLAKAGQVINLGVGATSIEVINPMPDSTVPDMDNGIVLRLSDGKVSFLLTSDISTEAELDLITRRADLNSTVLKVAHHGSDNSSSAAFLAVVDPQLAVISVGADNTFGHPGQETLQRLTNVVGADNIYRTDKNGTVECITNGEKLWVKTKR